MTDNDARGRIAVNPTSAIMANLINFNREHDGSIETLHDATDRILAIVREALLSEEAVEAAFTGRAVEVVTDIPVQIQKVNMDKAKAIEAAWQAAFPESQEPQ